MTKNPASGSHAQATRILSDTKLAPNQRAEQLLPLVYEQLRAMAQQQMNRERKDHTLEATALVHEAYVRLIGAAPVKWANRAHFFSAAVQAMRRILIDHARACQTDKRDARRLVRLQDVLDLTTEENISDAMILDELLSRLEKEDPRAAQVVRLRFFTGLSIEDVAKVLDVSLPTVKRDWKFARAWLLDALAEG